MLIQDPIYETIALNDLEKEIIDTPLFQRLRYVSQLSGASSAYPCGIHNRFSHSIGAAFLAGEYTNHLFPNNKAVWQLLRISALLHDIAHGPFSHTFDDTVYKKIYNVEKGHDEHRIKLLSYFKNILQKHNIETEFIKKIWNPQKDTIWSIYHDIIQGDLGADRMDYLLRDSYFTGSNLCSFTWNRIIKNSIISDGVLCYKTKLVPEIYLFLLNRTLMYHKVYRHKTSLKITVLLEEMLINCVDDLKLVDRVNDIEKFIYLNDYTIIGEIMTLPDNHKSKIVLKKYLNRDLNEFKECEKLEGKVSGKSINFQLKEISWYDEDNDYEEKINKFLELVG